MMLIAALVLAFGACSNLPVLSSVEKAAEFALFGQPDVPLQRSAIEKLPYASIRAKMGKSGHVLMVLGRYDGTDLHWISADKVALVTRGGRLVKSAGLPENLKYTGFAGDDPVSGGLHRLRERVALRRVVDIDAGSRYGLAVTSTLEPLGSELIEILERSYETVVVRETNVIELLNWEFQNFYWADAKTGFVWKSIQYTTPGLPPVEIEILKPAA